MFADYLTEDEIQSMNDELKTQTLNDFQEIYVEFN